MNKVLIGLIIVVLIVVGFLWNSYNKLVTLNEGADAQWSQVESQYQRRFDLIPNLVNSVKGILTQEQTIFNSIAEARTRYSGATSANDKASAASDLESSLGRLLVIIENYPTLNSSVNVQDLMAQLEGTENRISVERGRYNDAVRDYNLATKRFPGSLVAGIFGFDDRTYFESKEEAASAPEVNL